jgi:CheY-like chemotaxis protein
MPSVLIIEDDDIIRNMYSTGLTHNGFQATAVNGVAPALEQLHQHEFDVILVDMLMPGLSGLDFMRQFAAQTPKPRSIVIALTNLDNPAAATEVLELGASEYLTKSNYEPADLAAHLKQLLAARRGSTRPRG